MYKKIRPAENLPAEQLAIKFSEIIFPYNQLITNNLQGYIQNINKKFEKYLLKNLQIKNKCVPLQCV